MHILLISRGFPTEKYKMNGIFEFDQAKALAEVGCNVVYAAIDVRSIRRWRKWGIERKQVEGVEVYIINIPGGKLPAILKQQISTLGLKILYKKILREQGKPEIIHAHFTTVGYTASKLINKTNIPFVLTEHYSELMKPTINNKLYKLANQVYEVTNELITVSPALKNVIKERFNKESIYIPNVVDTKLFNYSPTNNGRTFRFVSIGGLIYRKRMDLTIKAFIKAFKKNDKVFLTIFGEGPERPKLENLIRKNNLGDRVKLMGLQSRKNIANNLKKSDCFVLTSQAETFGVVYIEALASGVPVIATKCGGPEGFINDENGLLIPVDDFNALADAMKNMYNEHKYYDKKAISKEISEKFSSKSVAVSLKEIYLELIKNGVNRK